MENVNNDIPGYTSPGEPKRWYHNGWFSRSFLIVAGLFFFLPFIDIKCSGTKLATIKGSDMIFGSELKIDKNNMEEHGMDTASVDTGDEDAVAENNWDVTANYFEKGDNKNIAPNVLAIGAFTSVIMAFIFSFFAKRLAVIVSGGFALLAVLGLFFIQFQVHNEVETKLGPLTFSAFTFEFTPYYWSCLLFLAMAAMFSFVRSAAVTSPPPSIS